LALYRFDLSHLRALFIRDDARDRWARFSIQTVEALDVLATVSIPLAHRSEPRLNTEYAQLDSTLSTLGMRHLPTVEVENFMIPTPEAAIPFFLGLISRDMVSSEIT
jgi:hypothetical protein